MLWIGWPESMRGAGVGSASAGAVTARTRLALLESLYASGADLLLLPIQDAFGWRDRINQPATVGEGNWTWRLPWPVAVVGR